MSFFAKKEDHSSSSSSEESSDSEKETQKAGTQNKATKKPFYAGSDQSDEEEDRVVVAKSEKRETALKGIFDTMANHIKIRDFGALGQDFDAVIAELAKCVGSVFATDKFTTLPPWVLKNLVALDDCVLETTKEQQKKMNKNSSQAYNKLKQKLRKYLTENGDEENRYSIQVAKYRENPVEEEAAKKENSSDSNASSSDDDSSSDEDSSSDGSDSDAKPKKKAAAKEEKKKVDKDSSAESESESDSDSDESSSDDSDSSSEASGSDGKGDESEEEKIQAGELPKKYAFLALAREEMTPAQRRWRWVKYEFLPDDMKPFFPAPPGMKAEKPKPTKPDANAQAEEKKPKVVEKKDEEKFEAAIVEEDKDIDHSVPANVERLLIKYRNHLSQSRRNYDLAYNIQVLLLMLEAQKANLELAVEILIVLLTSYFASAKNMPDGFLDRDSWLAVSEKLSLLVQCLVKLGPRKKKPVNEDDEAALVAMRTADEQLVPTVVNFLEKLDSQLHKAFQSTPATSLKYLYRLRDECILLRKFDETVEFLKSLKEHEKIARLALMKLEHVYYKSDSVYKRTKEQLKNQPDKLKEIYMLEGSSEQIISDLVDQVLQHCPTRLKIKAVLLQAYHHAIHNRFLQAKDLIMRSRIQHVIAKQQVSNQVHYNRAFVQCGLAAFRLGLFDDCNALLNDASQSPKLKESLAQGFSSHSKQTERSLEDEIEEKKRYVPPHLHINLELLDCVYMTTSMLQEIPNLSENKFTVHKNVINRNFRKVMDQYDAKGIQFLAQSSREQIVFAARALHQTKWQEAYNNIISIKIFQRLEEFNDGALKESLKTRIKQVALKVYLIESGDQGSHDSFGIGALSEQFELTKPQLLKIISSLIAKRKIHAKICLETNVVIFETKLRAQSETVAVTGQQVGSLPSNDRKHMENLQETYLGKITQLVEANERCMELLITQNYFISNKDNKYGGKAPAGSNAKR